MNISEIRKLYPALSQSYEGKRLVYFDNACSVLKARPVIEAVNEYNTFYGSCAGNRSVHYLSLKVNQRCDEARESVRRFIGARYPEEIVWTKNATESLNLIASAFKFRRDKKDVIVSNLEHHSNLLPFYLLQKRGLINLKIFELEKDGSFDSNKFSKLLTKKVALVSLMHVSNVTGGRLPIKEIAKLAHKVNALVSVDDSQFLATHRQDVMFNEIDFLSFSSHKIGGPTGLGVLYIRKEIQDLLDSFQLGGGTVQQVKIKKGSLSVDLLPVPFRFEAGIQNYSAIFGIKAAVELINQIGYAAIGQNVALLAEQLKKALDDIPGVKILGGQAPNNNSLVSFSFVHQRANAADFNIFLNNELKDYLVAVRCGHHCAQPLHDFLGAGQVSVRASFFAYNTPKEVEIFIDALQSYLKKA
jgi:cysteine desulfurase/selenocysteine lyase